MKDFFDRALSIREKVNGKLAVAFTSGGGSSNSALLTLEKMISSFRLEKIAEGVVSQGTPSEQDLAACKKLGEALQKQQSEELRHQKTKPLFEKRKQTGESNE